MLLLRLLALSLLLAVAVPAVAPAQTADLRRKLSVTGQSSTLVANDAARLSLGVQATRPSPRIALQAASRQMQRVISAVKAAGIAPSDIRTQNLALSRLVTRLKGGRTKSRGYRATQSIRVIVRDVDSIGVLVQRAVGAGATQVSGPDFFVLDASRLYREALGLAFDDAEAAAEVLAQRAGARLGPVLSIDERTSNEPEPQVVADAPSGAPAAPQAPPPPVQAGQTRVDATVDVVFELVG